MRHPSSVIRQRRSVRLRITHHGLRIIGPRFLANQPILRYNGTGPVQSRHLRSTQPAARRTVEAAPKGSSILPCYATERKQMRTISRLALAGLAVALYTI